MTNMTISEYIRKRRLQCAATELANTKEKVIAFDVDCVDPEAEAWGKISEWCKEHISDRTARRFVGLAPKGHHPGGEEHKNAEEHVSHPYRAMMFLIGEEATQTTFYGKSVEDAPSGIRSIYGIYEASGWI